MKTKSIAACLVIGAALTAPIGVRAADGDSDRALPAAFVKDSVITTNFKTKLAADKVRSLKHDHVDTDRNGMVVLNGIVGSQEAADAAVSIARKTDGVTSVKNNIKIKKRMPGFALDSCARILRCLKRTIER